MENVHAVTTVARQVNGEYVFIIQNGVYKNKAKAEEKVKELRLQYYGPNNQVIPQTVNTEAGQAVCMCEVKAFEVPFNAD